jgi:hypothetical protein
MIALQQAQVKIQMDASTDRQTLNTLAENLTRLLNDDDAPRGRSTSKSQVRGTRRGRSEYHDSAVNRPVPLTEREAPTIPEYSKFRSARVPDPPKLNDGRSPTYDYWQVQIIGKFKVNADHYANEDARIYYVFNYIKGNA